MFSLRFGLVNANENTTIAIAATPIPIGIVLFNENIDFGLYLKIIRVNPWRFESFFGE